MISRRPCQAAPLVIYIYTFHLVNRERELGLDRRETG
jgi:hypothetical protein